MSLTTVDRISKLLRELNFAWLLPNLRQDILVWNCLNEPDFYEKFARQKSSLSEFTPADFSPARLALLALDQSDLFDKGSGDLLESIDSQILQNAIRGFNDETLFQPPYPQNLAAAGLIALALVAKYQAAGTWDGLLDIIQDKYDTLWLSPLTCLYGFVSENSGLLDALVQPGASSLRMHLAVHIVLSNPIEANEQVAILMGLCRGPYGDLIPPRERLLIIRSLFEQSPQTAIAFCSKWLEAQPELSTPVFHNSHPIEDIDLLVENLFQIEVNKVAGDLSNLPELLVNENEISQQASSAIINHCVTQLAGIRSENSLSREWSKLYDQILHTTAQGSSPIKYTPNQAGAALILADQGNIEEASRLLPPAESTLPDDPNILYAIARVSELRGDHQRATDACRRIVDDLDHQAVDRAIPVWGDQLSLVNLGKLLIDFHKPDEAARVLDRAVQICPNDASLLVLLAESEKLAHKDRESAKTLRVLVSLNPDDPDYHRLYAQSLEAIGDWETSLTVRSSIIEFNPDQPKTIAKEDIYAYANCGLYANHPEITLSVCEDLLDQDKEDSRALIYSGKAYLQMGDTDQGMEYLIRATQVSPDLSEAWLALAEAQKSTNSLKTVIDTLTTASQSVPDSPHIHFALGELYLQDNTPSLALPELHAAVTLSPDDPKVLVVYGQALKQLGHIDECCEVLSKAYHLEPDHPGLAQLYADILVSLGKLEEAIVPLEVLINSNSSQDIAPYLDYARCVLSLNKLGMHKTPPMRALIALNHVIQIDPDHAETKALIAESLAANGDNEMAFQAYREALDTSLIDDKDWLERLSYGFGCVASSIGKHDVAIAALQEASQLNPDNPAIYKDLSDAYLSAHLADEAIRSARNVLVIDGDDPNDLSWFAEQATKLIRLEKSDTANLVTTNSKTVPAEALNALTKAIQLAPMRTDLLIQLGKFQADIGAFPESRDTFASLASMDFAAIDDLTTASEYLHNIGDHAAAIACLENAITQDQKQVGHHDSSLYRQLADEYVINGDHTAAINTLDKAIDLLPEDGSLVTQKIEILLSLNQTSEALNCIETAIRNSTEGEPKADLLFLACKINRSIGDFLTTIRYAHQAISAHRKSNGADRSPGVPAGYRSLIADIYRSFMQPMQAYRLIQGETPVSEKDFSTQQSFLDFIFQHTELALETGEQIRSDFQDLQLEIDDPFFPRLMAIKARLMNKAGNYKQADQILQLSLKSISNLDQPGSLPSWSSAYTKYLTLNSIVEAALDLGLWDQAINGAECVLETSPSEPWSYLNLAKAIVLRAEFYNLCQVFEVSKHKPSEESISGATYSQFSQNLEQLKRVFDPLKSELISDGDALDDGEIYRWQARADIAFQQAEVTFSNPCDILLHQQTPGDAAAVISYLHQQDLRNHEIDSVSQIIKIARSYPRNPSILLQVALAINADNPEEAIQSLLTVLEQNSYVKSPSIAFCNILLAKIAQSLDQFDLATKAVEGALDIWRDEPAWHTLAAQIYKRNGDPSSAINHLLEASKLSPKNVPYHVELGKIYFENANDDTHMLRQALKSFENALGIDPENVTALISLANTQYLLNDQAKAEANARKALLLAPNRADIYQLLGEIAIIGSDFQGAYEYANKAIQLSPKDVRSGIILARSLAALGRHNEALTKLNSLLPAGVEDKFIQLERVDILRRINGPRAGVNELITLTNSFPDDFYILNALAKAYLEVDELENAVNISQQALQARTAKTSHNEQANLHLLIGQVLRKSGQLDQSIEHLNEAIQLAPDRLEPYLELGLARKERREYQQALRIFEQATSIAPEDPRAPFQAGLALKESKDYKSSETMLRRAVSLAPNDLNIRRQLAAVVALNLVHNPRSARN